MQTYELNLQSWTDNKGILEELPIELRIGGRLKDNSFVLTQCIQISREESRPLYVAFLDISGAYDNVDRNILWDILEGESLGNDFPAFQADLPRK